MGCLGEEDPKINTAPKSAATNPEEAKHASGFVHGPSSPTFRVSDVSRAVHLGALLQLFDLLRLRGRHLPPDFGRFAHLFIFIQGSLVFKGGTAKSWAFPLAFFSLINTNTGHQLPKTDEPPMSGSPIPGPHESSSVLQFHGLAPGSLKKPREIHLAKELKG